MRVIIHVDMDCFYAAVEVLDDPSLKGKPVIVGGGENRGVVSAASYEAREFGVRSAMPIAQAKKLCPHGIYLPVRGKRYYEISKIIREIFYSYTPLVEPISLDEAFLDVTGSKRLFGDGIKIGKSIQSDIRRDVKLEASVGIASNKHIAKIASDLEKPQGFVYVPPGNERKFLDPLPVERLWGVGPATAKAMKNMGLRKIKDIVDCPYERLKSRIGEKYASHLQALARGEDDRPVIPRGRPKSFGHETTFMENISEADKIEKTLLYLTEKVINRMCDAGYVARTISLKIRNTKFKTTSRAITVPDPVCTVAEVFPHVIKLLELWDGKTELRLVGVHLSSLTNKKMIQSSLFAEDIERVENLEQTVRDLRERFGKDAIKRARLIDPKET